MEVRRGRGIAADHPMRPQAPDVASTRHRERWQLGDWGLLHPSGVQLEVPKLGRAEPCEFEIATVELDPGHLGGQHCFVPLALEREPVVRQPVLTLLRVIQVRVLDHGHLLESEELRSGEAAGACRSRGSRAAASLRGPQKLAPDSSSSIGLLKRWRMTWGGSLWTSWS